MKLHYLLFLTLGAYFSAVALRSISGKKNIETAAVSVAEKKKFTIRCSPLYTPSATDDIPLLTGWGNYSWKITTKSDSAQVYFNQGINMYYAFHIIEARASFDKATRFDPECAMAWWGKALAFGPNINDFGYQQPSEAFPSASQAIQLKTNATKQEQALIDAMAVRYSSDSAADQDALNTKYKDAMKLVFNIFPKDENITTLYADALMLVHPWDLYDHDFKPMPWTPEIVATLKHAIKLNPKQPGANHLFIHAVEASAKPGEALKSATFLATAMPEVSHLTHMPSHIYIRTGVYDKGIALNDEAVKGYNKYENLFPPVTENVSLYLLHNIHMKLNCAQMAGNYKVANEASISLRKQIPDFYLSMPGALGNYVQYLYQSPLFTWVRFGKWQEILAEPVADSLAFSSAMQQFARGMAFAHLGKISEAEAALAKMEKAMEEPSLKEVLVPFNDTYSVSLIANGILAGTIAEGKNESNNAIAFFKQAVATEDNLIYNEPRDWLIPARHYLGAGLIKAGKYDEAIDVFKKDLQINPNNGWALTGLAICFKKLKDTKALAAVEKKLTSAWVVKDQVISAPVF